MTLKQLPMFEPETPEGGTQPEDSETLHEKEPERYAYFMRNEPLEDMGPIQEGFDAVTGKHARWREVTVGMLRNDPNPKKATCYLEPFPHIRLPEGKPLQGWYQAKLEPGHRPRPCFTEAILTQPYGGWCYVGCGFCYINAGQRGWRSSGLVTVVPDYPQQVRTALRKMRIGAAGYLSSFTDPFLSLEDVYHNSQRTARIFLEEGLPVFFLSRLSYPGWAFDILKAHPHSYAQKSLNTGVDEDYKRMSPGALPLEDHLQEIKALRAAGIYTSIQVNPVLAGIVTHDHIRTLFERLSAVGNNHVIVKFVEASYSWVPKLVERLTQRFGEERVGKFTALMTQNIGGQRTIEEVYRLEAHALYQKWATELGMTYATCYEYKLGRDEKGAVVDKHGVSVGREFTTSAQCHGPHIPVYERLTPQAAFTAFPYCPPSGCLYCPEQHPDGVPCGNPKMAQAKALRMADFKQPLRGA